MGLYINFDLPVNHFKIPSILKNPLFANNSQVYYKTHSLAPGGIGTVKNHRRKAIKT